MPMLDESLIKDKILRKLESDFRSYSAEDFPLDIMTYMPRNPTGELLIKSLGYRPTQYLDRNNQMNPLSFGDYVVYEYQWRITIINKNFKKQDEIFAVSRLLNTSMRNIDFSNVTGAGRFFILNVDEPQYHEQKKFHYRTHIFSLLVITYLGED